MDQPPATTPATAPAQLQEQSQPIDPGAAVSPPGFGSRGRVRRRARFLRKARELAYRDLGGLVFNLHRFGQRNDALVIAKLTTLGHIDSELRALEAALSEREPVTILREAGITACPRCAAIHSGEDRFCPNCGLPMSRHSNLPIAGAPAVAPGAPAVAPGAPAAPATVPAPSAPAAAPATAVHPAPPATATHAAVPAGGAVPAPQPEAPATQSFAAVPPPTAPTPGPAGGRSPTPPPQRRGSVPAGDGDDQPTEIIRPPATGP